jgi:hypothetical protein
MRGKRLGIVSSMALSALSLLVVHCTHHPFPSLELTSTGGAGAGGQTSGSCAFGCGGSSTTIVLGTGDAALPGVPLDDAGVDAGPTPTIVCGADAGASDTCELPPSYCPDPGWLVFYATATCADGLCQYERRAMSCVCENGGCKPSITL